MGQPYGRAGHLGDAAARFLAGRLDIPAATSVIGTKMTGRGFDSASGSRTRLPAPHRHSGEGRNPEGRRGGTNGTNNLRTCSYLGVPETTGMSDWYENALKRLSSARNPYIRHSREGGNPRRKNVNRDTTTYVHTAPHFVSPAKATRTPIRRRNPEGCGRCQFSYLGVPAAAGMSDWYESMSRTPIRDGLLRQPPAGPSEYSPFPRSQASEPHQRLTQDGQNIGMTPVHRPASHLIAGRTKCEKRWTNIQ